MRNAFGAGLAVCLLAAATCTAQTPAPVRRFEVGAELNNLGFVVCFAVTECPPAPPRQALGVTASWNIKPWLALDSALRFTTQSLPVNRNSGQNTVYSDGSVAGGRATEFLTGPRVEASNGYFGLFAATRIGLLSWSDVNKGYSLMQGPGYSYYGFNFGRATFFTVNPAIGVEYPATRRIRLRAEVGQHIVHYYHPAIVTTTTSTGPDQSVYTRWRGSFTAGASASVAFGGVLPVSPPREQLVPSHRFFDRTNAALFAFALLAESGDAITTQRFRHHGIEEADLFAKPLVDQGWPGQVGLAVLANGAALSFLYGLHRLHQHWAERLLPVAIGSASGYLTYSNLQLRRQNVY